MEAIITNPTSLNIQKPLRNRINPFQLLRNRYAAYVLEQDKYKLYWYMKIVLIMTNAYMVISSFVMAQLVDRFEYFIGFTVLIFFTNLLVHIVGCRSKVYVPVYHFSLVLFIFIPLITYLITLIR